MIAATLIGTTAAVDRSLHDKWGVYELALPANLRHVRMLARTRPDAHMPRGGWSYSALMDVQLLRHVRHARNLDGSEVEHRDASGDVAIDEDFDDVKVLGIYSSPEAAANAISRARSRPGFADEPDCFVIDAYALDEDGWTDGFVTITEPSD